jgi:hypothetical protein
VFWSLTIELTTEEIEALVKLAHKNGYGTGTFAQLILKNYLQSFLEAESLGNH